MSPHKFRLPARPEVAWQLRPFIKIGQQTNYLYEDWPANVLPPDGNDLDFAAVKNRLGMMEKSFADNRLKIAGKWSN